MFSKSTGLLPESLRLEVTENVVLEHVDVALENLNQLRAMGIQFSIDDFGTGYSSLSYLQRFHYDQLKIDRSFVSRLSHGSDSRAIVETILGSGQQSRDRRRRRGCRNRRASRTPTPDVLPARPGLLVLSPGHRRCRGQPPRRRSRVVHGRRRPAGLNPLPVVRRFSRS